jgi:hypothetical protein
MTLAARGDKLLPVAATSSAHMGTTGKVKTAKSSFCHHALLLVRAWLGAVSLAEAVQTHDLELSIGPWACL